MNVPWCDAATGGLVVVKKRRAPHGSTRRPGQRKIVYSLLAKPSRCSRLVNRLNIDTNKLRVAIT